MNSGVQQMVDPHDAEPSRLEAALMNASIPMRPMSRGAGNVSRHVTAGDHDMREFDLDFSLCHNRYPFSESRSLHDLMTSVQLESLLANAANFDTCTNIQCFEITKDRQELFTLNQDSLEYMLSKYSATERMHTESERALLCFSIPRVPREKPATYGCKTFLTSRSMRELFAALSVDPAFAMNTLGRPDYWAPVTRATSNKAGDLEAFEFSCQHPRWHLTIQGSPLAVYMKYIRSRNLTVYILAHKENDTTIDALKSLLQLSFGHPNVITALLDDPFHIHAMLSNLSFEASKRHVEKFRRFMHAKMEQVHDHLEGLIKTDRDKLGDLTAGLQVISQNADSHIANAEVAIRCAEGLCAAHTRLLRHARKLGGDGGGGPSSSRPHAAAGQTVSDMATYVLASLRKQKMWFVNYKSRKDGAMNLVYNLVTQNDAGNNLGIAQDMRRDSASMSAIAALTMVFLPGTFTATFLDAGIWHSLHATSLWWVWLALTVPLTLLVFVSWRLYHAYTMIKVAGRGGGGGGGGKAPRYHRAGLRDWVDALRRSPKGKWEG